MLEKVESPAWQVEIVISGGKKYYRVFRVKDPAKPDTADNRESRGGLHEKYIDADRLRCTLNGEEYSYVYR